MTDWDEVVENIRNAMAAVEGAHGASQNLRREANHANFEEFRAKMRLLEEHLRKLKVVLDHEEAFAMDELMDALSKVYSRHRAKHRGTPRMED